MSIYIILIFRSFFNEKTNPTATIIKLMPRPINISRKSELFFSNDEKLDIIAAGRVILRASIVTASLKELLKTPFFLR